MKKTKSQKVAARLDAAAELIQHVRKAPKRVIPVLLRLLDDKDLRVRAEAAYALGHAGLKAKAAIPKLADLIASKNRFASRNAASALGKMGAAAKGAVPKLMKAAVEAPDFSLRLRCVESLALIGTASKKSLPMLVQFLDDENEYLRAAAAKAIPRIASDRKKTVSVLTYRFLREPDAHVRKVIVAELAK